MRKTGEKNGGQPPYGAAYVGPQIDLRCFAAAGKASTPFRWPRWCPHPDRLHGYVEREKTAPIAPALPGAPGYGAREKTNIEHSIPARRETPNVEGTPSSPAFPGAPEYRGRREQSKSAWHSEYTRAALRPRGGPITEPW
jgi:hypothetical protein